jgi:hypothetical protein
MVVFQPINLANQVGLNEMTLCGQESRRIDNRSRRNRSGFVGRGRTRNATLHLHPASGFATASRLTAIHVAAAGLAALATEDAVKQIQLLLAAALRSATVVASATGIHDFTSTTGIDVAALVSATALAASLEQVQQRSTALLGAALGRATVVASTTGINNFASATRIDIAALVCATRAALVRFEQVQQWSAALLAATLRGASVVASATGINNFATTAGFTTSGLFTAAAIIRSEHSVEQVESEALCTQAEAQY